MILSRHHFPLGCVHTSRWTDEQLFQYVCHHEHRLVVDKKKIKGTAGDWRFLLFNPCFPFSKFRFDVNFIIRLYNDSFSTWVLGFIEVNSKFTKGENEHEKKKACASVHCLHVSTSAQLQYRIHCLRAWMSKRILQFLEREQNNFHYLRNPFLDRNFKQWRLQSIQTFLNKRTVEKPSSETLLRLAELVLTLNLQSKIFSETSKSSAVIPKLNIYFLYHHLFHSDATKTKVTF